MDDCIFCKIVKGEISTEFEKQSENLVVFKDVHPQAPIHLLIVPRKHIRDITQDDGSVWADVGELVKEIAKEKNILSFRLVNNAGEAAQVKHMHVHFLGEVSGDRKL